MKHIWIVFLFATLAVAQAPRPYISAGVALSRGAGYQPVAGTVGGGLVWETSRVSLTGSFDFDTARKTNDGTTGNHSGHEVSYGGTGFWKLGKLFIGGGGQVGRTSTTLYTKSNWHPKIGGGIDLRAARLQFLYLLPARSERVTFPNGTHCACPNNSSGGEFKAWLPTPNRHLFITPTVQIIRFHNVYSRERLSAVFMKIEATYRF